MNHNLRCPSLTLLPQFRAMRYKQKLDDFKVKPERKHVRSTQKNHEEKIRTGKKIYKPGGSSASRDKSPPRREPVRQSPAITPTEQSTREKDIREHSRRSRQLRAVFEAFDLDGSGSIETEELLQLGKARRSAGHKSGEWTNEMNRRLVEKMDVNSDGLISCSEFVRLSVANIEHWP